METVPARMEQRRLLDVPITEREHHERRISSDDEQQRAPQDRNDNTHSYDAQPTPLDFELSSTPVVYQINNSGHTNNSQVVHQRIPSDFDDGPLKPVNFAQATSYSPTAEYSQLNHPPDLWRPFWIQRTTLAIFLFTFLSIIVGVVLLWHYSNSLDGFHIPSSTRYYAWTYAPVAFMVVLVGLWRQVDYYFKLLGPWSELRNGPTPASQSLLLDYVSPINIVTFFTAFKRGYTPIILSVIVFFSLKVITIFSAALLISLPTDISSNSTSAVVMGAFDTSSFDPSAFANVAPFSSDPVYSVLGNIAHGIPFPTGVTEKYAYIPVEVNQNVGAGLQNATYEARTQALSPNLSCIISQPSVITNTVFTANRTTVNTTTNLLQLHIPDGGICSRWVNASIYAMNPQKEKTPSRQIEGTMQRVFCADDQEGSKPLEPAGLLFTLTDMRYNQTVFTNGTIANSSRQLATMTNILCTPGYYVLPATIKNRSTVAGPGGIDVETSDGQTGMLEGLSNSNLAFLYDGIMNASQGIFGTRAQNTQAAEIPSTVFNLMALVVNKTSLETFLDPNVMQTAAESTFGRIMSYYAAQSLTNSTLTNTTVQATHTERKLHISFISFYIVLVFTAFSALSTIVLMIVAPPPLIPKDPSMMATSATVLARSPELNRLLRNQISTKTAMGDAMREFDFATAIATPEHGDSSYKIVVTEATRRRLLLSKRKPHNWWSPNYQLIPALILAIVVPAALIALLQYLQRHSDNDQGFITIDINPYTALYIRCIPVLVMLLIAAMVGIVDFKVALFSPLNKLAEGNANARRSLLSHLLGKIPPIAYYEAFRGRHFGALFSIPAAAIASVFAIIAAGLYSTSDMTFVGPSQSLQAVDTFQMGNWYNVSNDRGAAGILRMIGNFGMAYPRGTFDDLVFPNYNLVPNLTASPSVQNSTIGPFTATIPTLRANLKCDIIPANSTYTWYLPASPSYNSDRWQIDSYFTLPEFCQYRGRYSNSTYAVFSTVFNVTTNQTYFYGGEMVDLAFGQNASPLSNFGEEYAATTGDSPPEGCPSLGFTFVEVRPNTSPGLVYETPTSLICYQQLEQLQANVTFQFNSTELDPKTPPVVANTSVSLLKNPNSTSNANSFDWRIQSNIDRQLFGLDGARLNAPASASTYQFDAFFSYLFNNTYKEEPATLVGDNNSQDLIDAINTLYRKYMAQAINANMRVPLTSPGNGVARRQAAANPIEVHTNMIQERLVQNPTSKLTLQILLGITILFCILAYLLTSFHLLLPYNPATIAGTMSLLAGSDLVWTPDDQLCDCCGKLRRSSWSHELAEHEDTIAADPSEYHTSSNQPTPTTTRVQTIPDGAEWLGPIQFAGIFCGKVYSLGWWREDRAKGRRRRFGVDIGGQPDSGEDDEWELGDRRPRDEQGFDGFMVRGRSIRGDHRGHYQRAGSVDISAAAAGSIPIQATYGSPGLDSRNSSPYLHGRAPMPSPGLGYQDRDRDQYQPQSQSQSQYHHSYRDRSRDGTGVASPPVSTLDTRYTSPPLQPGSGDVTSPRRVRFEDEA